MALLTLSPEQSHQLKKHAPNSNRKKKPPPSSWYQFKNFLTCKQIEGNKIHDPSRNIYANAKVVHRADNSPESSTAAAHETRKPLRSVHSAAGGIQLRKLSGCYECHAIVDPSKYPLPRTRMRACSECGEVFPKLESLEHHQAVRHAVSELAQEDSSRSIVEIIFKSSWLKNDNPICKIERILKVHNTQRTIQRFEDVKI